MHGLRHDDELPSPVSFRSGSRSPLYGAGLVLGTAWLIAVTVLLFRWATAPIAVSGTSASTAAARPPAAASPVVVTFPDTLILVTHTPEPTIPPTATYVMSTETPPLVCGPWVKRGQVCEMRGFLTPTPTPMSDCPVGANQLCVWRGGTDDDVPITATPTFSPATGN